MVGKLVTLGIGASVSTNALRLIPDGTPAVPAQFDVVINEIIADPSPIVGLPDAEFVELHNTTNYNISTNGWTFEHGTTVRNLPNVVIPADSFLVITNSAALADLSIYGNVAAVPNLSSTAITNSGTTLTIKDNNGQIIHVAMIFSYL